MAFNMQIFCLSLLLVSTTSAHFMVNLKFLINEEKLPEITTFLINSTDEKYTLTPRDIIELSTIDKINLEQAKYVANLLNITNAFSVDNLEHILKLFNINYRNFKNSLCGELKITDDALDQFLINSGISPVDYYKQLAKENDTAIFIMLRDITDLDQAISINDLYEAIRKIILEQFYAMETADFVNFLQTHGFNRRTSRHLWSALNITAENIYSVDAFKNIFDNLQEDLNKDVTIGVIADDSSLLIHDEVYRKLLRYSEGNSVKTFINEAAQVKIYPAVAVGNKIKKLSVDLGDQKIDSIAIIESYRNVSNDCVYITLNNDAIITESVQINGDGRSFSAKNNTVFNIGSAVICDDYLYGLVGYRNDNVFYIDQFSVDGAESLNNNDDISYNSSNIVSVVNNYVVILFVAVVFSLKL